MALVKHFALLALPMVCLGICSATFVEAAPLAGLVQAVPAVQDAAESAAVDTPKAEKTRNDCRRSHFSPRHCGARYSGPRPYGWHS